MTVTVTNTDSIHPRARRPLSTRIAVAAAAVLAVPALALAGVGAGPAEAHDQLLSSDPAPGAVLAEAPAQVTLVFSDELLDLGGVIVVADAAGTDWAEGELNLDGTTATQALAPGAPAGAYQVRWRVVSSDGHPISDVVDYSVGESAAPPIAATALPTPAAEGTTPDPTETADAGSGTQATDAEQATDADTADTGERVVTEEEPGLPSPFLIAILALGGAAVGIGIYAALAYARRRRRGRLNTPQP
jgi:methionine-rich copper-binding protein CopC